MMVDESALAEFLEELRQDLLSRASLEGEERLIPIAFTERVLEDLIAIGEIDDGEPCHLAGPGYAVSGYGLDEDEGRLDLFVSLYRGQAELDKLPARAVNAAIEGAMTFYTKARDGLHHRIEEASPAYDMALRVSEAPNLQRVRVFVLTDALSREAVRPTAERDGALVSYHVWDLERLHQLARSGVHPEPLNLDISSFGDFYVPCIQAPAGAGEYKAYLAIFPGELLAMIYSAFGPRLLELNVRSYLQARGKVNAGIRRTILEEPEHFLAYNNGISITAAGVRLELASDGNQALTGVDDMQIVNGGQTTASIFTAWRKDKADLSQLAVAAKVTVVPSHLIDEFVPYISRYANSQNKVNEADFAANDPFHVSVEQMSRSVWAPAPEGTQRMTKWFYERARGQYADALARQETPSRKNQFRAEYPPSQKFTKTDLAKFEHAWEQYPHLVSRGAEKNFREFAISRGRQRRAIGEDEYHDIVARAILFRATEKIVTRLGLVGYRANVVAYSIAYLAHETGSRVDMDRIWQRQSLPHQVSDALEAIAPRVYAAITEPEGGGNVGEWAKKEACWHLIRNLVIRLPAALAAALVPIDRPVRGGGADARPLSSDEAAIIERVKEVDGDLWMAVSHWAKQTGNLAAWQRSIAFSLGRLAKQNKDPSLKQAVQGVKILEEVQRLGFKLERGDRTQEQSQD